jgi:prepilin-type processing-associated H-X9-DG protein
MVDEPPSNSQILDYAPPPEKRPIVKYIMVALAGIAMILLVISILLPSQNGSAPSRRVICQSNLRQIGQAILLYSDDNGGKYPNDLGALLTIEGFTTNILNCPSSNDTPATGATTQAVESNLTAGGHLSYIYLGKGMNAKTISADTVVAYEPLSNHGGDGSNMLFGDGHVEFIDAKNVNLMEAKIKTKQYPVTLPSGS